MSQKVDFCDVQNECMKKLSNGYIQRYMMDAWSSVDIEDPNPLTLASVLSYQKRALASNTLPDYIGIPTKSGKRYPLYAKKYEEDTIYCP